MADSSAFSRLSTGAGWALLALGVAVFAVRLQHDGAYAVPRGGNLFGGLGALGLGAALVWGRSPAALRGLALLASPVVLFFGLYATLAEFNEVISLYAKDSTGTAAELRLWIVDRDDGAWVGMSRAKAVEHSLDGARLEMLRGGELHCVVPVLHDGRPTVRQVHAQKLEKYAVARAAAAIGLYPSEARESSVSLRFDACPET